MNDLSSVLVTGGAGKIGRFLCMRLRSSYRVTVMDKRPLDGFDCVLGDIQDPSVLRKASRDTSVIVHLAGIPSPRHSSDEEIFRINTLGTWNVLQSALSNGVRRVVLFSSDFVTGLLHQSPDVIPDYLPIDELHPCRPTDAYALSKLLMEDMGRFAARRGLEVIALRPGLVIDGHDSDQWQRRATDPADPDLWWYTELGDLCEATLRAVQVPLDSFQSVFVGAKTTCSSTPTLDLVLRRYGRIPPLRDTSLYARQPNASLFDTSLASGLLNFEPAWRPRPTTP